MFIDSGASNHITSHAGWFRELPKPNRPSYVETGDDIIHPIQHVGNVPLSEEGSHAYIKNVLHVPTITKNLVLVSYILEQGMQVWFNDGRCFIKKEGRIIARNRREGQMFILDSHEMKLTMFAKGDADIELWHKRIDHIEL